MYRITYHLVLAAYTNGIDIQPMGQSVFLLIFRLPNNQQKFENIYKYDGDVRERYIRHNSTSKFQAIIRDSHIPSIF